MTEERRAGRATAFASWASAYKGAQNANCRRQTASSCSLSGSHAEIVSCRSDVGCCHPWRIRFRYAPGVRPRWRRNALLKECAEV